MDNSHTISLTTAKGGRVIDYGNAIERAAMIWAQILLAHLAKGFGLESRLRSTRMALAGFLWKFSEYMFVWRECRLGLDHRRIDMTYVGMARRKTSSKSAPSTGQQSTGSRYLTGGMLRALRWGRLWGQRILMGAAAVGLALVVLYRVIDPPTTYTMWSESQRLGHVDQQWVSMDDIAPVMRRSVVAAEDANFCRHWGFDMNAIRMAMDAGGERGASTITQQTVKNVFLWQGRNWLRKAIEAVMTPVTEVIWNKRRILEVYLNVAEFSEGVFGINAAAFHYFRTTPDKLTARQASLLAAVLPDPKGRSASHPSRFVQRRASAIADGARTIRADGRSDCFE